MCKSMAEHFNSKAKEYDDGFTEMIGIAGYHDSLEKHIEKSPHKDSILILGSGTGLELERIHHTATVLAIDIADDMIRELKSKQFDPGITLTAVCSSIFDYDFGKEAFDLVLSSFVMHHFTEQQKLILYKRVHRCLTKNGAFLDGDIMVKTREQEEPRLSEAEQAYKNSGAPYGSLHIGTPLCFEHEKDILLQAGFSRVFIEQTWDTAILYRALK